MTGETGYDVILAPLTEDDLELVRGWRNSPQVRKFMDFQAEITPGMQREWFGSISNAQNRYFVIVCDGKQVGVSNVKNIDHAAKSAEAGLFIADPQYLDTPVPIQASLTGLDICFGELALEELYIKTADDNAKARRLNAALGYEPVDGAARGRFRHYRLTKKSYYEHREYLMDLLYGTE